MYKSPVELYVEEAVSNIVKKQNDEVLEVIQNIGIHVDKDELIKALQYDRNQYDKGYSDAMATIVRCCECQYWESRNSINSQGICRCEKMDMNYSGEFYPFRNDYCSYGERKDEG